MKDLRRPRKSRRGPALLLPLALGLLVLLAALSVAEVYQWTDGSGTVHFTDNLLSVPPQHRDQIRTRSDRTPSASSARSEAVEAKAAEPVPLEQRHGSGLVVQARLNGTEAVKLVVDTGATMTVLSPGVVKRLGVEVHKNPGQLLQTANGVVEVGWAELESLEVGRHSVRPLRILVHEAVQGADGLLGMNFLRSFRVEIRSEGPTLHLSRP